MKYWSKKELTLWPRSMNSSIPLPKRCGSRLGVYLCIVASREGPDVVGQCTDGPSLGLYKSHNRRSGTPFICAEYRGCRGGNQERRPDTPNDLSRFRRR